MGAVLSIIGGVLGAAGGVRNSRAEAERMRFQSKVAKQNAALAQQEQQLIRQGGQRQQLALRSEEQQARGEAAGSFASSGVALNSGSALRTDIAIQQEGARTRDFATQQTDLGVFGKEVERRGLLSESRFLRRQARKRRRF